jgi:hypothetical protein
MRVRASAKTEDAVQGADVKPVVKIDNQSDNYSTIVKITYGDKLGELMDTVSVFPINLHLFSPILIQIPYC